MDQYIGKMLDNRYELLELIGSGGMANVYKTKCHRLNRLVAVKILKSDLAQNADFRRRFRERRGVRERREKFAFLLAEGLAVSQYGVAGEVDESVFVHTPRNGVVMVAGYHRSVRFDKHADRLRRQGTVSDDIAEADDALNSLCRGILENLVVFKDVMMENIYRTRKVIFAQRVMNALIEKGFSREKAYDTVQPIAMRAMSERADYQELLAETPAVMDVLTREELDACFTLEYYLKNVDFIFDRVGIE